MTKLIKGQAIFRRWCDQYSLVPMYYAVKDAHIYWWDDELEAIPIDAWGDEKFTTKRADWTPLPPEEGLSCRLEWVLQGGRADV